RPLFPSLFPSPFRETARARETEFPALRSQTEFGNEGNEGDEGNEGTRGWQKEDRAVTPSFHPPLAPPGRRRACRSGGRTGPCSTAVDAPPGARARSNSRCRTGPAPPWGPAGRCG